MTHSFFHFILRFLGFVLHTSLKKIPKDGEEGKTHGTTFIMHLWSVFDSVHTASWFTLFIITYDLRILCIVPLMRLQTLPVSYRLLVRMYVPRKTAQGV